MSGAASPDPLRGATAEERFVRSRIARWRELEELVKAAEKRGLRVVGGEDVRRLGALYRATTSDLALARTLRLGEATERHVNRLCTAAHGLIYAGRRRGPGGRVQAFLGGGFARLVRATWRYHAAAASLLLFSALVGFAVFLNDPALAREQMGGLYGRAERALSLGRENAQYIEMSPLLLPLFSWGIMANNISVTLVAFSSGIFLGLGSALLLVTNGVHIGGAVAVYQELGAPGLILTFMSAHGPLELTAICVSAGAGMRIGFALLLPGRRTRARALRETARESIALLGGSIAMLVLAGLLEGFVSPVPLPDFVKWTLGGLTAAGLVAYFAMAGRPSGAAAARVS